MARDLFRARSMTIQEVLLGIDKALTAAQIEVGSYCDAYFREGNVYPELGAPLVLSPKQAKMLLTTIPLAAISSRFVPAAVVVQMRELGSTAVRRAGPVDKRLGQVTAKRLEARRVILTSFYAEAGRMLEESDRPEFADNLILEVADLVLRGVPLGLAYSDNGPLRTSALVTSYAASDIRAQISWGVVLNFRRFRVDVLALAHHLLQFEKCLGNEVRQPLPRVEEIAERSHFFLTQAALMYKKATVITA